MLVEHSWPLAAAPAAPAAPAAAAASGALLLPSLLLPAAPPEPAPESSGTKSSTAVARLWPQLMVSTSTAPALPPGHLESSHLESSPLKSTDTACSSRTSNLTPGCSIAKTGGTTKVDEVRA